MKSQNPFRKQINIFLSRSLRRTSLATFTTVLTLGLPGTLAHAATFTWDGGPTSTNSFWGNAGNWVGDVTPTFNNEADIILTGTLKNGTILSGNRTVRSVTFNEPSIAFSIKTRANASATGGAANLIFSAVSGNASITVAAGTAATTIDSGSVTGAGVGGGVILNSSLDVFHDGANLLTIGNISCPISGVGAIGKSGTGTLVFAGNNTYLGDTTITAGVLQLGTSTAIPDGPSKGNVSVTGTLDINGQTETINGLSGTGIVDNTSEAEGTLSIGANDTSSTFGGVIQNTGFPLNLTKVGAGNLVLTGNSTFAGPTTITAGKVVGVVGGSATNSSVLIDSESATCSTSITDNTLQWTYAGFTTNAAGTLEFSFASTPPSTSLAPLTIAGAADFNVTPTMIVTGNNLSVGTYPLMTWDSTSGTAPSTVALPPGVSGILNVSGTTLNLVIQSVTVALTKADNTDNLNLTTSWTTGSVPGPSDIAPWDSTVTSANTTFLGGNTTWGGIKITDPNGLVTIDVGNALTLGAAATDIDMASATADLRLAAALVVGDTNVWNIGAGRDLTLSNEVSGSSSITKLGAGMTTLSGANTFSGGLVLNTGILNLNNPTALGSAASTLTIAGGASINNTSGGGLILEGNNPQAWNADFTFIGTEDLDLGTGAVTPDASRTLTVLAKKLTVGGIIGGGAISLTKEGVGELVLNGDNTFTDSVTINNGSLTLGGSNAFSGGTNLNTSGKLGINHPEAIGTGTLTISSSSFIGNNSASEVILATNNLQEWNGNFNFVGPDALNLGTGEVSLSANREVTVSASTLTVGGVISGPFSLTKLGTSTLVLNAENTFTGPMIVGGGGAGAVKAQTIADAGVSSSLGAATGGSSIIQLGVTLGAGSLEYTGASPASTNRGIQIGANGPGTAGSTIINNNADPAHTLTFTNPAFNRAAAVVSSSSPHNRTLVFAGSNTGENHVLGAIITNAGTNVGVSSGIVSIAKSGDGTWKLSGVNSYTGDTTINAGILRLGGPTVIPDGPGKGNLIVNGTLDMNSNSETVNGLSGSGTIDTIASGNPTLTVGGNDQSGTFTGVIQNTLGSLGLTKTGTGSLSLAGTNTYTGDTTVSAGTLVVNGNSIADTNKLTINAGVVELAADETVDTLYVGSFPQQAGTHGSSAAVPPVTFPDDTRFSGTGVLTVITTGPITGFSGWITGTFANGTVPDAQQGPDDDPDADGVSNLVEYAIEGFDPTVTNGSPGTLAGKFVSFSKRQPLAADISYTIESSTDLGVTVPWGVVGASNTDTTISFSLPAGPDKDFARLRIIQP